jgi:hypothetical protein
MQASDNLRKPKTNSKGKIHNNGGPIKKSAQAAYCCTVCRFLRRNDVDEEYV